MPSSFLCGICGVQMPHNGRKTCDDCKPLCIVCGEKRFTYHLRRKFPITVEEARALADVRECAVCHARAADWAEARKMLHVDHDHATGRIRGVLCRRCNLALSALEGDKDWIVRLQSYMAA